MASCADKPEVNDRCAFTVTFPFARPNPMDWADESYDHSRGTDKREVSVEAEGAVGGQMHEENDQRRTPEEKWRRNTRPPSGASADRHLR
jgi:hypothetical protein